ncbi:MAG TPA: prephenate dehydrogenase/arogenate dehydrogenase family protein [Thermoanaerobaculia bacterium]|nr:prephenate dehydrogenase/arogenate dehydrogenase family protein [Thermoanaerobaculia bacterium]
MTRRRALIAGLGAMGTSIALALRESWDVFYIDRIDDLRGATKGRGSFADDVDLTIIATPEDEALRVLPQTRGLVTSICSLMGPLRRAATGEFIAGHPMAGTERSGPDAARADMFRDVTWYLDRDHPLVRELIETCGAKAEIIDADEHDREVALGSHLPQLLSTALAAYLHGKRAISATGLRTFLRLAGSSGDMWKPLIADNRDNIAPHAEAVARVVREMLDGDPTDAFRKANELYESIK